MGGNSSLQNEGAANSSRPAEAGRLASQGGLERCLLHGSSPPRPPPLPEVCDRRGDLPVHLPSIWASCAPWVFTKLMKTVVTLLRSWGFRMIIYIDDILDSWSWQNQRFWSDSTWRCLFTCCNASVS